MTEKQMLKLEGKRVRFTWSENKYSIKKEVIEGVVAEADVVQNNIIRNNKMVSYTHYDMNIDYDDNGVLKRRILEWNTLKNITNLEVLE